MNINKSSSALLQSLILFGFALLFSSALVAENREDGYYVKVHGDSVSEDTYQKMALTLNENCWMANPNLLDSYIYLYQGISGFSIVDIKGGVETVFAAAPNFGLVTQWLYYEPQPQANFARGQFNVGDKPFTVTESGLYYIAVEVGTRWISIIPVKKWNVLGTAITGGWEPSKLKELSPIFSDDKKSAVFTIDSLEIKPGFLKFRFTNGWKITVDSVSDNDCWNKGSKVNTNFGGSIDSLFLGGGNVLWQERGIYSVKLFWQNGKYLNTSFVKIKDIPIVDYSKCRMGILGDAYFYKNGNKANWENNWGDGMNTNVPIKLGDIYTWTFDNVKLYNGGEFKFRQGDDWMGLALDFQDIKNWSGDAKADFNNMDGKFHVVNDGEATYDFILKIDAATEIVSITVNKH